MFLALPKQTMTNICDFLQSFVLWWLCLSQIRWWWFRIKLQWKQLCCDNSFELSQQSCDNLMFLKVPFRNIEAFVFRLEEPTRADCFVFFFTLLRNTVVLVYIKQNIRWTSLISMLVRIPIVPSLAWLIAVMCSSWSVERKPMMHSFCL